MAGPRLATALAALAVLAALAPSSTRGEEDADAVPSGAADSSAREVLAAPPYLEGMDGIITKGGNWSSDPANWPKTAAIKVRGSIGGETEARVKVRVEGKGTSAYLYRPQQTFIAVQDSGAMATNDPAKERVGGASTYVDQLVNGSQVGIVKFPRDGSNAVPALLRGLTSNYTSAKAVLEPANFNQTGSTPLRDALHMANNLLVSGRLAGFTQNIVLMSNGCFNTGGSPWPEVNRSANESIRIFSVGLYEGNGSSQKANCEGWMMQWANATGGKYLWMRSTADMAGLHAEVERILTDVAGTPQAGSPMVAFKLSTDIEVVNNSWVCDPGKCASAAPDNASAIKDGNRGLWLNWSVPTASIRVGEVWQVEFGVRSYVVGPGVKVNDAAVSRVLYAGYDGTPNRVDKIEQLLVDVTVVCPGVCIDRVEVSPAAWTMKVGEAKQFAATAFDQNNNTIPGAQWSWNSSGGVGSVNSTGFFTAAAAGAGQVSARATYNGTNGSGSASVTVADPSAGAPFVVATTPVDAALDVSPLTYVILSWNESMDKASAENATGFSPAVVCAWSWSNAATQVCAPSQPLATFTKHTVTISTSAKDSTGVAMKSPFAFSFTTGGPGPAPNVVSTVPLDGAIRVPRSTAVQITFSTPMDSAATESAFAVSPLAPGAFSWSAGDTTLAYVPSPELLEGMKYAVSVGTGAKSKTGVPLPSTFTFTFTVQPSALAPPNVVATSPGDSSTGVATTALITLWFDQVMDTASVEAALVILPGVDGPRTWSGSRDRLDVKGTQPLIAGARYTLTIAPVAQSANGIKMTQEFRLRFTVAGPPDVTPPTIVHDPVVSTPEARPVLIKAQITDASGLASTTLRYRKSGETDWVALKLSKDTSVSYVATVPAANVTPPSFEYWIEAWDTQANLAASPANGSGAPYVVKVDPAQPPGPDLGSAVGALGPVGIAALIAAAGIAVAMFFLLFWKRKKEKKVAAEPPPSFFSGLETKGAAGPVLAEPPTVAGTKGEAKPEEEKKGQDEAGVEGDGPASTVRGQGYPPPPPEEELPLPEEPGDAPGRPGFNPDASPKPPRSALPPLGGELRE
jgi:hypothetical protein